MRLRLLSALLSFLCFGAVLSSPSAHAYDPLASYRPGHLAPDFSGVDQFGKTVHLRSLAGKWVVLDFCGAWCGPCQNLDGYAAEFAKEVRSHGIPFERVIVMTQNAQKVPSMPDDALKWAVRYGITSPVLSRLGLPPPQDPLYKQQRFYGAATLKLAAFAEAVGAFPTLVLIDPQQRVRKTFLGVPPAALILRAMGHPEIRFTGEADVAPDFGVLDYQVDLTVGANSATFAGLGIDWSLDLAAQEAGSDTPSIGIVSALYRPQTGTDLLLRTFFTGLPTANADAPAVPHDVPFTVKISNVSWDGAGDGILLPERVTVNSFNRTKVETAFPVTPVVAEDGSISCGPFTLAGLGLADEVVSARIAVTVMWARPEPLARVQKILNDISPLQLSPTTISVLSVPFAQARAALAPGVKKSVFAARLQRAAAIYRANIRDTAPAQNGAEIERLLDGLLEEFSTPAPAR
jgi:thiol-disulfide isomerase/thioredoxin